ncbi:MAG TPA: deoxyribodipyrimidine photo-lyase [Usitatibacteraceae bacterium]|nr:deoxyribodipyrimidine photo-lyase [Usitatibacteraceae bacterium]
MPKTQPGAAPQGDAALFWFRRDLRLSDNAGLNRALQASRRVHAVFVFDREILDALPSRADRRVEFIWQSAAELQAALRAAGGELIVLHDHARTAIPALAARLGVATVFTNEDYEPRARARDAAVAVALQAAGIGFTACQDTVIVAPEALRTGGGKPYTVFTPYKNAWLKTLRAGDLAAHASEDHLDRLARPAKPAVLPTLAALGFEETGLAALGITGGSAAARRVVEDFLARLDDYDRARDFPSVKGVSYLSVHNRFGTISIRTLAGTAYPLMLKGNAGAAVWLSELIWRDFYFQILWHHPHVAHAPFKPAYAAIAWENNAALFRAWCEARTGFPLVDAAMRQLNQTGYMHNRLRMVVASFLTKDLLVDWRWGEQYFADHLNDFDLAANNGGWQWAASTGCDAQPYFRIFNPVSQSQRFDPHGKFIRRYVPELQAVPDRYIHAPWTLPPLEQQACGVVVGRDYPRPIVDHALQRDKALAMYKAARG